MITKADIKKEIKDIKTLGKAMNVVIADDDLRNAIILKMADKMMRLLKYILEERKITEMGVEYLTNSLNEIDSHIDEDHEIFYGEHFEITSRIDIAFTEIKVLVLD